MSALISIVSSISTVGARLNRQYPAHQHRSGTEHGDGAASTERGTRPDGIRAATDEDEQWQERALCAQTDPEAFFPEKGGSTREAKRICLGCEVKDRCLDYALAHDERFGIWGGLSERERRRLKRGII